MLSPAPASVCSSAASTASMRSWQVRQAASDSVTIRSRSWMFGSRLLHSVLAAAAAHLRRGRDVGTARGAIGTPHKAVRLGADDAGNHVSSPRWQRAVHHQLGLHASPSWPSPPGIARFVHVQHLGCRQRSHRRQR